MAGKEAMQDGTYGLVDSPAPLGPVPPTDPELNELLDKARQHVMTPSECEEQRRSFAAGNVAMSTGEEVKAVRERIDKMLDSPAPQATPEYDKAFASVCDKVFGDKSPSPAGTGAAPCEAHGPHFGECSNPSHQMPQRTVHQRIEEGEVYHDWGHPPDICPTCKKDHKAVYNFDGFECNDTWHDLKKAASPPPATTEREALKKLAKEMGDAGYCNYAACEEFLQKAFELALDSGKGTR